MSGRLTTHVLDTNAGRPAAGVGFRLFYLEGGFAGQPIELAFGATNDDGRTSQPLLEGESFRTGEYRLEFDVEGYFSDSHPSFLGLVPINFRVTDTTQNYHVPLVISPFGYSTYRGS